LRRQVEHPRRANQILLRRVRREHRPDLVLLAVNPGGKQHLECAASIPIALLVIGADAPHSGAETLWDHRRVRWIAQSRDSQLPFGGRRAADRADLAVRPGLLGYPLEGVVAVTERSAQNVVIPLGEKVTALVHLDEDIAALDSLKLVA